MVEKSFEPDSSLKNRSCDNLLKSCEDFLCGLPDPKSKGNNVSTLSTATFQSSHFEKDVFFVYDPDYDQVGAQVSTTKFLNDVAEEIKMLFKTDPWSSG